ncbi:MAG: associated Golgi protein-like protein [Chitinophagaceae bacterium]|jgi:membrane-associated protein|nr:associated Golgi protein-like protein [Chitinophagaceae bacterium]
MKRTLTIILFILSVSASAQQLNVILENQYEEALSGKDVKINGVAYKTDANGNVSIPAADSLSIIADGHDAKVVAVKDIPATKKVTIDRDFVWKDILNPMFYIINGGLFLILFIIFAETGLFVGFFLPGDSLLFVAGIYSNELARTVFPLQNEYLSLALIILMISFAGIIGNTVGYWFGRKVGPTMYTWKDRMLFKKKYLHQAHDFYEKHGGIAIVGARFLPMVRTFAPIIAGIVGMDKKKFAYYNILGSFLWVGSLILAGHFLQKWMMNWFDFDLKSKLEYIIIVIVLVTTAPVLYKMFFSKKKSPTLEIGKGVVEEEVDKVEDAVEERFRRKDD